MNVPGATAHGHNGGDVVYRRASAPLIGLDPARLATFVIAVGKQGRPMPNKKDVDELISDALDPFRRALAASDAEIALLEQELADAKGKRRKVLAVVRALDPETPGPGRKANGAKSPTKKASKHGQGVSDEKVDELEAFLRAHYNGDEFYGAGVLEHPAFNRLMSSYTITHAIRVLADRGVIRLDRIDKSANGQRKMYRLTRGANG